MSTNPPPEALRLASFLRAVTLWSKANNMELRRASDELIRQHNLINQQALQIEMLEETLKELR